MKMLRRAFTLVELLVVVAIIGILAIVVLMSVQNASRNAKHNTALSNINDALKVAQSCTIDSGTLGAQTQPNLNSPGTTLPICTGSTSGITANWPKLNGYTYGSSPVPVANAVANFSITPAAGTSNPTINCSNAAADFQCK